MESSFLSSISASIQVSLSVSGRDSGCSRAVKLRTPVKSSRKHRSSYMETMLTDCQSVVFAALIAASSISTIAPQITAFVNAAAAASELFSVIDKKSELDPLDDTGMIPTDSGDGNIEISNLAFAYPSRPSTAVLRNFNISISAGKTTALVGASGSGKSTVVGLLERWYAPLSGSITLDGIDISHYNTRWLRSHIRLVQQVYSTILLRSVACHLILW